MVARSLFFDSNFFHFGYQVVDSLSLLIILSCLFFLGFANVHVLHEANQLHIFDFSIKLLLSHVFQSIFILVKLDSLLKVFVSLNIIHEVFKVFVVLFFFLLFALGCAFSFFNHHTFILKLFQLEDSASLSHFGQTNKHNFLIAIDFLNFFSIVQVAQVKTFNNCSSCKLSHVSFDLNIDPFSAFSDIIIVDLGRILVKSGFYLVIVLSIDWIAIQNLEGSLVLAQIEHLDVLFIVIVLHARHQDIVETHQVNETHCFCHLFTKKQLRTSSELFSQLFRNDNKIILADFWKSHCKGIFIDKDIRTLIMRDKLLRVFNSDWKQGPKEVDQPLGMSGILVVKVYTVILHCHFQDLIISSMLQDELFDQKESLLMVDMLPDLNNSAPCMRSELFLAIITLHVDLGELSDKGLLHPGLVIQFFFNSQFNLDSFRVRLGPYESCLQNFGTIETFDLLEQQGKKLLAIPFAGDPGRPHITMAKPAKIDNAFFGDSDSDICFGNGAGFTDIADGGYELYAAHGAEDGDLSFGLNFHC